MNDRLNARDRRIIRKFGQRLDGTDRRVRALASTRQIARSTIPIAGENVPVPEAISTATETAVDAAASATAAGEQAQAAGVSAAAATSAADAAGAAAAAVQDAVEAVAVETAEMREAAAVLAGQVLVAETMAQNASDGVAALGATFVVTETGAEVRASDGSNVLVLSPDGMQIVQGGVPASTWDGARLIANEAVVNRLQFANHVAAQVGTDRTVLRPIEG